MKAKSAVSSDDMRAEYDFDYSKEFGCRERGASVPTPDVRGNPAPDFALQRAGDKRPPLSARVEGQRTVNRNGRIDVWPDRRASCLRRR